MDETQEKFEGWAILELMGHRRLGGMVTETQIAGAGFLRIDIPAEGDANPITQFCAPSSVYAITPVTEAMARAVARRNTPQPVSRWELPEPAPPAIPPIGDDDVIPADELDEETQRQLDADELF